VRFVHSSLSGEKDRQACISPKFAVLAVHGLLHHREPIERLIPPEPIDSIARRAAAVRTAEEEADVARIDLRGNARF
jgi:hypothetical protein